MRKLIGILAIVFLLTSCVGNQYEYKYKITFTDGTEEFITSDSEINLSTETGCVTSCGCGNDPSIERCGVRKVTLLSERKIEEESDEY